MTKISNYVRPGAAGVVFPGTPGSTGGTLGSVTDGSATVAPVLGVDFTAGATVTDLGGGVAGVAISAMTNPMTTQDDIIVGGVPSAGVAPPTRLAKGSDGQVLTVDPTTHHLLWATPTGGMTNPMTTVGDGIVGGTVTGGVAAPTRVAAGTSGYIWTANGAGVAPTWQAAGGGGPTDYASGASGSGHIVIPDLITTAPTTVPGLVAWFAADALSGYANGDPMLQWPNRAPGVIGMDATAVGTPTYQTSVVNSLPVVRFGGSAYFRFVSPGLANVGLTFFLVFKMSSIAPAYSGILGSSTIVDRGGFFVESSGKTALYAATAIYDGTGSITYGTTNWNYTSCRMGPQTFATRRNGSADASGAFTTVPAWLTDPSFFLFNQFNGGRVASGDIAEFLGFSRPLTSAEVTTVESYLSTKYAL